MKKTIFTRCILLLMALLMLQGTLAASAEEETQLIMGKVGDTFSLQIKLSDDQKISANELSVEYAVVTAEEQFRVPVTLTSVSPKLGSSYKVQNGRVHLTSKLGYFSGLICTLNLRVDEYDSAMPLALFAYIVRQGNQTVSKGNVLLWIEPAASTAKTVRVGDMITFGTYEQDNNRKNGQEPISWRVLDVQGDRALVISEKILDQQVYHPKQTAVTWETCWLRGWLNGTFCQTAFTAAEQAKILTVTVPAHESPYYHTESSLKSVGNPTKDRIFLLSAQEANKYFSSNRDRIGYATKYAIGQGVHASSTSDPCGWLMRQPHKYRTDTACVNDLGNTSDGVIISHDRAGIRPAMWISLK